jgi:serine/threonine protein kinase/Tol biopolymer transport system component
MPLVAGSRLDSYEIITPLGAGGMGEVYRARDAALKRDVAIKVLPEYWSRDPERLRRFEQEAQATAALNHPNIVSIFHVGQYEGSPYIVTELLQGESLRDRLRKGPLRLREVLDHGVELARGLAAAHDAGIVHRDLKPDNIWVTKDGRIKILDFGLAKLDPAKAASSDDDTVTLQQQTRPGQVFGTVGYMSPEQVRGQVADARSDIFAVGVILYEMLTGKPAFRKATSAETMTAILNEDPPAVSQLAPSVPPGLQKVVNRCLAKNPAQRVQHASDLEFALEALSESGSTSVAAIDQRSRPRWMWASAAAVIVGLTALAIAIAAWMTPTSLSDPLASKQITFSAEPKNGPLVTDGSRLYFESRGEPSEMAISGGMIARMPTLETGMVLQDISQDASTVLAWKPDPNNEVSGGSLWVVSALGGTPRRLGHVVAQAAQWSPDHNSVLYAGQRTIYRCDPDGTNIRKLWNAPGFVEEFRFSPDGRKLTATVSTAGRSQRRLWGLRADGNGAQPLLSDWPENQSQWSGQWTSDGKHFVFTSDREGRANVYELVPPRWFEFWKAPKVMRITGNQVNIQASVPAHEGEALFVLGRMDQGAMQAYDPNAKKFVPFREGLPAVEFVLSPDRQWMAYTEYPSGYLWKSRLDGSDPLQLTNSYAVMQQWSPDGKSLVYCDWQNLYMVSADGGAPEKLTLAGEHAVEPTWSHDGKSIAFSYYNFTDEPLKGIHVLDLASGKLSPMPDSEGYYVPSWSPDGKFMVAIAQNPSRMMLYMAETKTWKELIRFDAPWGYWIWSSDSKSLYMAMVGGQNGMYRLTVPAGHWEKVAGLEGIDASPADSFVSLTPEGQPAIMNHTGVAQIYALQWNR